MSLQNKRVLQLFFREVWSQGCLALIDELFARDWVGHTPACQFSGPAELSVFIAARRLAIPDLQITVEVQIAEADKVATRWRAQGTQRGELEGVAATGKLRTWTGITLARLANGKIIEDWTN